MMYERDTEKMYVCEHCLMAIESREGNQKVLKHYIDDREYFDSDEEYEKVSKCDWCEENGFDVLYEL